MLMKNLIDIEQKFSKEIMGIPYNDTFPMKGKIARRKFNNSFIIYEIINVDFNTGIITMVDNNNKKHFAVFQTKGKDMGKFCYANYDPEKNKYISWHQKDIYFKNGHIVTFLE